MSNIIALLPPPSHLHARIIASLCSLTRPHFDTHTFDTIDPFVSTPWESSTRLLILSSYHLHFPTSLKNSTLIRTKVSTYARTSGTHVLELSPWINGDRTKKRVENDEVDCVDEVVHDGNGKWVRWFCEEKCSEYFLRSILKRFGGLECLLPLHLNDESRREWGKNASLYRGDVFLPPGLSKATFLKAMGVEYGGLFQDAYMDMSFGDESCRTDDKMMLKCTLHGSEMKGVPHFDYAEYKSVRQRESGRSLDEIVLFTDTITSTQTFLNQNYKLQTTVPSPLLHIARHQTQGRGRAQNTWISSYGCLQYSLLTKFHASDKVSFSDIIFVQYIMAMAVVSTIRSLFDDFTQQSASFSTIRDWFVIKWPNDIYFYPPSTNLNRPHIPVSKLGGILVQSSVMSQSHAHLIIGCGLNVSGSSPTTTLHDIFSTLLGPELPSLSALIQPDRVLAKIISHFDRYFSHFLFFGFFEPSLSNGEFKRSLYEEYRSLWCHQNQLIRIHPTAFLSPTSSSSPSQSVSNTTTYSPSPSSHSHTNTNVNTNSMEMSGSILETVPRKATIQGLNREGYLSASDTVSGGTYDLVPDGNRFDLMRGLIVRKSSM